MVSSLQDSLCSTSQISLACRQIFLAVRTSAPQTRDGQTYRSNDFEFGGTMAHSIRIQKWAGLAEVRMVFRNFAKVMAYETKSARGGSAKLRVFVWLMALLCVVAPASAQLTTGSIAGNILDPSGALVPHASIIAVGEQSGLKYSTTSSSAGIYRIANIIPGAYDLTIQAPGFQTSFVKMVVVQVSTITSLDISLNIGENQAVVDVNADTPTVQTQSSVIATTITNREVEELPLSLGGTGALRSPEAFVYLVPGVSGLATRFSGASGLWGQRISGGQAMGQEILLDGASVDRSDWHQEFDETAPSVDAIQEFTLQTSTIPAEYSRTAGGINTFVTKSGTNQFHSMLYDIFRNEALDANSWFNNGYIAQAIGNGTSPAAAYKSFRRGTDKKNDYGGTIGGPIWIPRIYNGRNKSFFFFSFEQYKQSTSGTTVSTIPTLAERNGDFSALLGASTGKINPCDGSTILQGQIFDPSTTRTAGASTCRTAFQQNHIDLNRFSNVANSVLRLLPQPMNSNLTQNYAFVDSYPLMNTTWTLRGDQELTSKQKLTLSYSHRLNSSQVGLRSLPYPLDPGHQNLRFATNFARVLHTYSITPSLVNQLVVGYNRYDSTSQMPTATAGVAWDQKLGIGNVTGNDFPQFTFNDSQGLSVLGSNINNDTIDNGYRINDTVTWTRGAHTFDFGANASYQEYAPNNFANTQGAFAFSSDQTSPSPNFGPSAGSAWASFLLGAVGGANATQYASQGQWRSNYFAFFVQDTYKVSSTLILDYGLNWSFEMPRRELHDRTSSFDPNLPNPGADNRPGALAFAGPGNRSFTNTYFKDFSPRVGFSWAPASFGGKVAVRGGYGIYYASLFYPDGGGRTQQGFKATPSFNSLDSFTPPFYIDNGFPQYTRAPFLSPSFQNGQGVDYVIRSGNAPGYIQNWSLQVQQELAPDLLFSIAYVGTKGTRLRSLLLTPNAIPLSALSLGTVLSEPISSTDAHTAGVSAPFSNFVSLYGANNATVGQALRKFPQYQGIDSGDMLENLGMSNFNALEAQMQRRFRDGLSLQASYTWSKTLTNSDSALPWVSQGDNGGFVQNPYDLGKEKAISSEDTPQSLVLSYIYELPFGDKRKWFSTAPLPVRPLISGWQVSAVQRYQSGQPIAFGCAVGVPDLDSCGRFSYTGKRVMIGNGEHGDFNPFNPAHNLWLNRAAFVDPNTNRGPFIPWQFGNVPRVEGGVRSQGYSDESVSLQKNTTITERMYCEFRAEAFNVFNRHVFQLGQVQPSALAFGQVLATMNNSRRMQLTMKLHF